MVEFTSYFPHTRITSHYLCTSLSIYVLFKIYPQFMYSTNFKLSRILYTYFSSTAKEMGSLLFFPQTLFLLLNPVFLPPVSFSICVLIPLKLFQFSPLLIFLWSSFLPSFLSIIPSETYKKFTGLSESSLESKDGQIVMSLYVWILDMPKYIYCWQQTCQPPVLA